VDALDAHTIHFTPKHPSATLLSVIGADTTSNSAGIRTESGSFGAALGFIFAYSDVDCDVPFRRLAHILALIPTISPPFCIAIAAILLFGRNGLVTRRLLADGIGIDVYPLGCDLFGMTGAVSVWPRRQYCV
jgi:ABC-type Fe3+ transport system permease subunit